MLAAQQHRQIARRVVVATAAMFGAAFLAAVLPSLIPAIGGRDFRPWGLNLAVLTFLEALLLRAWWRWEGAVFAISLVCAEIIVLLIIASYTGFVWLDLFDPFNLGWLLGVSAFFAAPWALGCIVGTLILSARRRATGKY